MKGITKTQFPVKHHNTQLKAHEFFCMPTLIYLFKYSEVQEP